jgi:CYTH domain-containing protein
MNNNLEIERKFLVVDDSYKQLAINHYTIVQGYICRESGRTVRVRLKIDSNGQNAAYLTIKGKPADGMLSRFEWEEKIKWEDAKQLLTLCQGNIIDKTRWLVPALEKGLYWEVDEFHGHKEGLTLAEIELSTEDQSFVLPNFIGKEVTGDRQYYNSNM